jgi:hypothetical protein
VTMIPAGFTPGNRVTLDHWATFALVHHWVGQEIGSVVVPPAARVDEYVAPEKKIFVLIDEALRKDCVLPQDGVTAFFPEELRVTTKEHV